MPKKSDDSLERFFKKAVAQQDISYRDADWKNMEKMLDEQALAASGAKLSLRKKVAAYSIVAVLFFSGMYLAVTRPWESASDGKLVRKTQKDIKPSQAAAGMLGPLSGTKENPSADLLSSDIQSKSTTNKANNASPQIQTEVPPDSNRDGRRSGTDTATEKIMADDNVRPDVFHIDKHPSLATTTGATPPVILNSGSIAANSPVVESVITKATDDVDVDSVVSKEDIVEKNISEKEEGEEETPPTRISSRWSVAVTVAPDFSSTSVGRYSAPGTAYGLFVSYRPLPRWQISTGLIKTYKQYEGYGDEYQPPAGYWENRTNGIVPDEVDGNCGIIEWPLILRYDLVAKANSRFYVATGVSSYLMRHESYQYRFAQENPGAASGWKSSRPTSYAFSIGHFSVGYERSFSNRVAIAIEPYFKVPFKAIGWSNIDLHTTGAYVTVRYTFQKQSIVPTTQK
jgi:hypothetical protein